MFRGWLAVYLVLSLFFRGLDFVLCLKPVLELGAGFITSLNVEFVGSLPDSLFEGELFRLGNTWFRTRWCHRITSLTRSMPGRGRSGGATDSSALRRVHFLQVPFHLQPGFFLSADGPQTHQQERQNTSGDNDSGDGESSSDNHSFRPHVGQRAPWMVILVKGKETCLRHNLNNNPHAVLFFSYYTPRVKRG